MLVFDSWLLVCWLWCQVVGATGGMRSRKKIHETQQLGHASRTKGHQKCTT